MAAPSTDSPRAARWARRILLDSLFLATAGAWGVYAAEYLRVGTSRNWLSLYWWPPYAIHLALLGLYAAVCLTAGRSASRTLSNLACSSTLFLLFSLMTIRNLGDRGWWIDHAKTDVISMAETLSGVVYWSAYRCGIDLRLVAPCAGWLACFLYLGLGDEVLPDDAPGSSRFWFRLYLPSLGFPILFFHNYIENTFLAIPFAILYLRFAIRYVRRPENPRALWAASASLALACLFHGQNAFMLPSLAFLVVYAGIGRGPRRRILWDALTSGGIIVGLTSLVLATLWFCGFELVKGNVAGGGDNARFVALSPASKTEYTRFYMLSFAHFVEAANIAVHASPAILVLAPIWVWRRAARRLEVLDGLGGAPAVVASGATTICCAAFVALWNFDVGFPTDLDLMTAMSWSPGVFAFCLLREFSRSTPRLLPASVLFGLCVTILFSGFFIEPRMPWVP